jgi:hypothetical protein
VFLGLVLSASNVIPVRVLAEVGALADVAHLLETGTVGLGAGGGTSLQNLLGEDLGGDGRQRGDAALQVVATGERRGVRLSAGPEEGRNSFYLLPIALHMTLLGFGKAESHLTGIARVLVRGSVRLEAL